jgi:hypothetical protein
VLFDQFALGQEASLALKSAIVKSNFQVKAFSGKEI